MNIKDIDDVHVSNNMCNPNVDRIIRIAMLTKGNVADCIKHMYAKKDASALSAEKESKRLEKRKEDLLGEEN